MRPAIETGVGAVAPNAPAEVSLEPIMRACSAYWITGILGAAIERGLFTHLHAAAGALAAADLAERAAMSPRGCQALLDGLVAIGLVNVHEGRYRNEPASDAFLVEGHVGFLGPDVSMNLARMARWPALGEAARTGHPVEPMSGVPDHPAWAALVSSIAPLSFPAARAVAARLRVREAASLDVLDVAGGAGAFSAVLLAECPGARATQIDWPSVNRVARDLVTRHGAADRFHIVDGDFLETDYGERAFDLAIYSHMAHGVSDSDNRRAFSKLRRALRPGGTLVVQDLVARDDGSGPPMALMMAANLLYHSGDGRAWRESDYRAWLTEAGFRDLTVEPSPTPATLIYAR